MLLYSVFIVENSRNIRNDGNLKMEFKDILVQLHVHIVNFLMRKQNRKSIVGLFEFCISTDVSYK